MTGIARDPILIRVDGAWVIGIPTVSESLAPCPEAGFLLERACTWMAIFTPQGLADVLQSIPGGRIWIARDHIAASGDVDDKMRKLYDRHMADRAGIHLPPS